MTDITAFPLQWPVGYPRTEEPRRSSFKATLGYARDGMMHELRLMNTSDVILSTNIPLKKDGMPFATYTPPKDKGVAVYFKWNSRDVVMACDKWDRIEHNIHAISLSITAMRGLDRWGVSQILERAFTGFQALPEHGSGRPWWDVMHCTPTASEEFIRSAYRHLIKKFHPDNTDTGNAEKFREVQQAYKQAIQQFVKPHHV